MSKKFLFDIDVQSNALLQVNPKEFFSKTLLAQRSTSFMRTLVNVKEKTKIGSFEFDSVLQEADCDFNATDSNLDAKTMEPCKFGIGTQLCQYDLEQSFLADWMKAGSNHVDFAPQNFMTHYYERLQAIINEELEILTWQGDSDGTTETFLDLCDGLEKQLAFAAIPAAQRIAGIGITAGNVIAQMTLVYNAIPKRLRAKRSELVWFVSRNVAEAYRLAVALASAEAYTNKDTELTFLGYNLVVADGASDNVMTVSLKDNYIFMTDLVSDQSEVITINMKVTTGDRKIRTISDFKFGVNFVNTDEFVVYGIAKQS
jgi:hypothetical protein